MILEGNNTEVKISQRAVQGVSEHNYYFKA